MREEKLGVENRTEFRFSLLKQLIKIDKSLTLGSK
jgi:hypothetical protein